METLHYYEINGALIVDESLDEYYTPEPDYKVRYLNTEFAFMFTEQSQANIECLDRCELPPD